jgi:hypothetical protein
LGFTFLDYYSDVLQKGDVPSPLERYFHGPNGRAFEHLTYLDYYSRYFVDLTSRNGEPDRGILRRFANDGLHQWRSQEALLLGVIPACVELIQPLANCPGLSESQQLDFIESIDTPALPPTNIHILDGDPFILLRNIGTGSNLAKERRCCVIQMKNRTVIVQFDDNETKPLTRIPMGKTLNGMKFVPWQIPLRLIFAGTANRSQGMPLQRAVIDCRTKLWEHEQLSVALSRVKTPTDLCILRPADLDNFAMRPSGDLHVVEHLERIDCPMELIAAPSSPMDEFSATPSASDCSEGLSSCKLARTHLCVSSSNNESDLLSTCYSYLPADRCGHCSHSTEHTSCTD